MDGLYWRFINRNRNFFLKNPRLSMMVRIFDKMKAERKKLILAEAEKFIKQNTIQWKNKIYLLKYAQYVKDHLHGDENGSWTGNELNIVLKSVRDLKLAARATTFFFFYLFRIIFFYFVLNNFRFFKSFFL